MNLYCIAFRRGESMKVAPRRARPLPFSYAVHHVTPAVLPVWMNDV